MPRSEKSSIWLTVRSALIDAARRKASAAIRAEAMQVLCDMETVLAEQAVAVDPGRFDNSVGFLGLGEMRRVDAALRIVLDL